MNENVYFKEAKKVTFIGVFINIFLFIIKILFGYIGGSSALIADGIHSFSDLSSDIVVLLGLKLSSKPSDENHKYGHGKYETFANLVLGIFLFFAALEIFYYSFKEIFNIFKGGAFLTPAWFTVIIAALSILFKTYVFLFTKKVGEKFGSELLISNAYHHLSDAVSSFGVLLGIVGSIMLPSFWRFLDPLAALILSIIIFILSFNILKSSFDELVERSIGKEGEEKILKIINSVEGVFNPHNLRTRKIGSYIAIDVHIRVNKELNVTEAHDIASKVEKKLKESFYEKLIINIHIEPLN